jgi:hypothetical protein
MSMRNHEVKFDRYECGEGNACSIAWGPIIGGVLGAAGSILGSKEQADSMEYAADRNAENARPKYYGPGMDAVPGLLNDAAGIYGNSGFAPGTNPLQLLGRQNALGYAEGALPGMIGSAQDSWLRGLNPGLDPYVGAMIESGQNDLAQDFARYILPRISDQAQATGGYGGSRQGVAQGIAAEGLMEAQGDLAANLLSNAYGQSLGQQRAAWAAAPSMAGLGYMPSQTQQDIGAMYRQDAMQPAQNAQGYSQFLNPYFNPGGGFQSGYQAAPSTIGAGIQGAMGGGLVGNWVSNAFQSNPYGVNLSNAPASVNSSLNNLWGGVIGQ